MVLLADIRWFPIKAAYFLFYHICWERTTESIDAFSAFLELNINWRRKKHRVPIGTRRLEALPRFELGVKVLQTSALPLGYSAMEDDMVTMGPAQRDGLCRTSILEEPKSWRRANSLRLSK